MKIDAHQHFWRYSEAQFGWIDDSMAALRRDFLPDDLARELAGVGIDGVVSVQARQSLQKEGFNAVRATGRWDVVAEMVAQLCGPGADQPVDGVLLVSYNHLVLYDCDSRKAAWEIQSSPESGGLSFQQSVARLIKYLKGSTPAASTP